jgi:hypothetical protein
MNKTKARRKWGEAYSNWYWANRHKGHPEFFAGKHTKAERVAFILEMRKYRELMKTAPPETNERGNTIYRDEDADRFLKTPTQREDRYCYDFKYLTPAKGWKQYDTSQDAWYYGVWVNIKERMTFSYCEGDRTLCVCPDDDHLRAELADMAAFHGDPPPAFICFSEPEPGKWERTDVYDTRPSV